MDSSLAYGITVIASRSDPTPASFVPPRPHRAGGSALSTPVRGRSLPDLEPPVPITLGG